MERELWPRIYHELRAVGRATHQKDVTHQPWVIAAVLLWAAVHGGCRSSRRAAFPRS